MLKNFLDFLWQNKLWWMTPIIILLALLGALILFTQTSVIVPFVYTFTPAR